MPKIKINTDKASEKEEVSQEKPSIIEKLKDQKGILPEDVDFRRGMGCG